MASKMKAMVQLAELCEAFERQAKAKNSNLSAWVGNCCLAFLPASEADKLPERTGPGKPSPKPHNEKR